MTAKKPASTKAPAKKNTKKAESTDNSATENELTALARECLAGKWRTGRDRDELLRAAGHDPEAVRREVYRIRGEQLANRR